MKDEVLESQAVVIEEPGGAKSYKAAVSMAASFHALRAFFEHPTSASFGSPVQPVYPNFIRVTPQAWQNAAWPGRVPANETKQRALRLARRKWPKEKWLRTPKCKEPDDGFIDAALIAEYGRLYL